MVKQNSCDICNGSSNYNGNGNGHGNGKVYSSGIDIGIAYGNGRH